MSSTTGCHSPGDFCRNSRVAGYQGLSFRCAIHRQSAQKGKSSHTGLPSAPARCATIVSTEITASMCAIVAAVSMKDLHSRSRSRMRHCGHSDISRGGQSNFYKLVKRDTAQHASASR